MFELNNVMRDYAWGSPTAIAALLGTDSTGQPQAELWMGAHPDSPSVATTPEGPVALDALIASDPSSMLGADVAERFDAKLPFLAKLLAADTALSLQVHPTLERAKLRFADEQSAGVARESSSRNYKDANHKPEMIFALTPFEALCGFRSAADAASLFRATSDAISASGHAVPELLQQVIASLNMRMVEPLVIRRAFEALINGGAEAASLVELAANALTASALARQQEITDPALATVVELARQYPGDPGVLISLLLNRVSLSPGQAIYLPAGNIHAYLNGLGLEVMASSDNVLRGGLTSKHVDVPELLATVDFTPTSVPYVPHRVSDFGQELWEPPFAEFALQRIELQEGSDPVPVNQNGPLLLITVSGSIRLDSPKTDRVLERGASVFVPASENPVVAHPTDQDAVAFAVTVARG